MYKRDLEELLNRVLETADFEHLSVIDSKTKGLFNNTPLHVAVSWEDVEAAKQLIDADADIDAIGEHGYTPLHEAILRDNVALVGLLLAHGAKAKIKSSDGFDCEQLAMSRQNAKIIGLIKHA